MIESLVASAKRDAAMWQGEYRERQISAQIVGSLEEAVKNKEAVLRAEHGEH